MPFENGSVLPRETSACDDDKSVQAEIVLVDYEDKKVETLEGVDFTKFVDVEYVTPEQAKKLAEESRARERPIDYRFIEQMRTEGVSEELAIKAFVGRFGGNVRQTQFFLNSRFYYGSDAPTPLDRLRKAVAEDAIPECIEMLEETKEGLERGDHF